MAVSGKDLIEAGMKPGKELGDVLQELFQYVLDEPDHNTKAELMSRINN